MIKKALAFTLAEVLITMSIVGVVAAMTIPTLHYQKTKKEYSTKLKNFYSKMDNAILEMQVDKGSFRDMKKPVGSAEGFQWYMNNIDPYMGHDYVKSGAQRVYFKDGSYLWIANVGGCQDVVYDVNGDKRPNREGKDRYRFLYCFEDGVLDSNGNCQTPLSGGRCYYFGDKDVFFGSYGGGMLQMSRAAMITQCRTNGSTCSRLLQNDQWEFKNDYPIRF